MKRVPLTDSGGWFDEDSALKFSENTNWDGNNHISVNTNSQWEHEALYLTRSGKWVLNSWSAVQGSLESYTQIDTETAASWLVRNGCDVDDIPAAIRTEIEIIVNQLEL